MINNLETLDRYSSYLAPVASLAVTAATSGGKPDLITAFTSILFDKLGSMLCKKSEEHKEKLNSAAAAFAGVGTLTAMNHFFPNLSNGSLAITYLANCSVFASTYKAIQVLAPTTDILSIIRFPTSLTVSYLAGKSINAFLTHYLGEKSTNLLGSGLLGVTTIGLAVNDLILSKIRVTKQGTIIFLNK